MKKLFGIICLVLTFGLFSNQAKAQVDFGIRGGVNFATFNNTQLELESRTGLMAGVYLNYQIPNSPISIQPEILYTQKGASIDDENGTIEYKLDYIAIPVLAKFDYVTDGSVTPHVYFGPYLGIAVSSEAEASGEDGSISGDIDDQVKNTDFGVVVGAGIDVNRFNVGVRYSVGLTPVFEADDADAKNGVISIVAGIGF